MAPRVYIGFRQVLFLSVLLLLFASICLSEPQSKALSSDNSGSSMRRRMLLEFDSEQEEESYEPPLKKKPTTTTKLTKTKNDGVGSFKNQTKTIKSNINKKNQTKIAKTTVTDTSLKKLNSTTLKIKKKKLNSTSKSSASLYLSSQTKESLDPLKSSSSKNKTTKTTGTTKINPDQIQNPKKSSSNKTKKQSQASNNDDWVFDQEENQNDELALSDFKDLPIKFQQTLLPDLERISTTSKLYITKANKEITKGFKPYVGNKYAPTIATLLSCAFVLIPLLLVSLLFNKIKTYFSLQKLLIFIQAYLSIYFFILCLSSIVTGLEPLRFFYATSRSTYVCLQVLQTLAYVFYLLLLVMYLVLVFSTDCGLGSRLLGLAQTFVGFSVGLHYYMTVFHRVVLRQAPRTNWKVHGIYATCFFLICLVARAETRKKTYLEEGGEEGKEN
ncbi:hypothetical protein HN51_030998 [Arachis hypogaea]|uniref:Uncharacterized protein n=2 Tax=Arachis hypogaea TaxID=3818 RepID=A0A445B8X9_ARAHY|nr:uncharacterized protein LOC112715183 [Arachis hypogaea]QHO15573.1 uncharacterized protein DS421_10g296040 [Arachis hypogaea]RYR35135.1 hypothetical protein Ahy_A10g050271 isoform C [Arachis hypogaea]